MFKKISLTIAFTYGLIMVCTLIMLDFIILITYERDQFEKNESKALWYAGVISNISLNNFDDNANLNSEVRKNSLDKYNRVMVLDLNGKVLVDTGVSYFGKIIENQQLKNGLEKQNKSVAYYSVDNHKVMMAVLPIIKGKKAIGAVLISSYADSIYKDIADLKIRLIIISSIAGAAAIMLSLFMGRKISKPIVKLTEASSEILNGKLNTKVEIKRADEIGSLAKTFNDMSQEIYKNDVTRKQFISDVSHELKTPLASIKALIESLLEGDNDISIYNEYLTDINGEIDRMTALVKSLLTATRLEEFDLKMEEIKLSEEIDYVVKLLKPLLKEKNIGLFNNCNSKVIIKADRYLLREVLINLIDNSIKYGKQNGFIELCCNSQPLSITVRDNGCGIPEDKLPNIFEAFYRVDESRNRDTGGNGIGLYIVKKIIKLHNWHIEVKSELGLETKFIITIK